MNYGRLSCLFPITMAILVVALISFSGCTDSAESSFVAPTFEEPLPPPIEVTVDQLYQEYMADETAADAKYKGERLLFNEVEVEEVLSQTVSAFGGNPSIVNLYFMNGPVRFKLRNLRTMQNIETEYVLNIVGKCMGLHNVYAMVKGYEVVYIIIVDCWVESVIGDIGSGGELDMDVY